MKLVACMESQDRPLDFLLQNRAQDLVAWHPSMSLPSSDAFLAMQPKWFWRCLLYYGKCPVCGISSALIPRQGVQRLHWFSECFMDGRLVELLCWRALLTDSSEQNNVVGIMQNCYMERSLDAAAMDDIILHQLAWYALAEHYQGEFNQKGRIDILQRMRFVYDALMEATDRRIASDPSPLFEQYRLMIDEIDQKLCVLLPGNR